MFRITSMVAALLCGLLLVEQASAANVKFGFSGEVVGYFQASSATMSDFPLGTPVKGFYGSDSNTMDSHTSSSLGEYKNAVTSLSVSLGNGPRLLLDLAGVRDILVANDTARGNDAYIVIADIAGTPAPGYIARRIGINFLFGDPATFPSDALPQTPPPLNNFSEISSSQIIMQGPAGSVLFEITSLTLIPEPTEFVLFGSGMFVLAVVRCRQKI